jgi:hypothetical protein
VETAPDTRSYLGNVFDAYQNMMQIARCVREASRQRGISQPRILELSRYQTDLHKYLPEAQITRYPTHDEEEGLALTIPVSIPFDDKSWDVCFVTDVYEHIPQEQRPSLMAEMIRVTEGLVLIGSPVKSELVTRFDRIVFDFVWGKYAREFVPAQQHVHFGLEPLEKIVETLKAQGVERVVALPDNFVYRFIHNILIFFDLQYENPFGQFYESVNRVYNERISPFDYREPCYRYLLLVPTDPKLDLAVFEETMKGPCETPAYLKETEGVLIEAFRAAESRTADELRVRLQELNQLRQEWWERSEESAKLRQEVWERSEESAKLRQEVWERSEESAKLRQELWEQSEEGVKLRQDLWEQNEVSAKLRQDLLEQSEKSNQLRQELEKYQAKPSLFGAIARLFRPEP